MANRGKAGTGAKKGDADKKKPAVKGAKAKEPKGATGSQPPDDDWGYEFNDAIDDLTPQQTKFVMEYVKHRNATLAYRAAYGVHLTDGTCAVNGHKLLRIAKVRRTIRCVSDAIVRKYSADPEFILNELAKLAHHANMNNFMSIQDDGSAVTDLSLVDSDMATAIKKLHTEEVVETDGDDEDASPRKVRKTTIEIVDRRSVLMDLAKVQKMLGDNFSPRAETAKIMKELREGEIDLLTAAYQFTELGLPLPEVIKIQLQKGKGEESEDETISPASSDELDAKYEEAIAGVDKQRAEFLPQRQEEVVALKEELKAADSFSPGANAEESPFEDFSPS